MKAGWRLALHVLAWTVAIPALSVGLRALVEHRVMATSGYGVAVAAIALLIWGGLIYWRHVPSAPGWPWRIGYLAAFLAVMVLAGAGAIYASFWIIVAIYGL